MDGPPIIAHRGHARICPENTLLALRSAVEHGARLVEFDLQLTADHVPVLLHDANLQRTAGLDQEIFELGAAQAVTTEVGEVARLGSRHATECIPTLASVVEWLRSQADVEAFVEIKTESANRFGVDTVVKAVVSALEPIQDRCIVISFDARCLTAARELGVERLGFCATALDRRNEWVARGLDPECILIDYRAFPDDGSVALWPGDWKWAAYEVVDLPLARSLRDRGIDLIETMAVRELVEAFAP